MNGKWGQKNKAVVAEVAVMGRLIDNRTTC